MVASVSLSQQLSNHLPQDSATRQGYVQLPIICGGPRYFSYVERTYSNHVDIWAMTDGDIGMPPQGFFWTVAGTLVTRQHDVVQVPAEWEPQPASNPLFPDFYVRPATASLNITRLDGLLSIDVAPREGNTRFIVEVTVEWEAIARDPWRRTASLEINLRNQEIVWEDAYHAAMRQCDRMEHLVDSLSVVIGPPQPGDPHDLIGTVSNALRERGSNRAASLKNAAHLLKSSRPEVAHALISLAQRASDQALSHRTDHPKDTIAPTRCSRP